MSICVSIITPCLNSEKTIRKTLDSVLSQSYPDIEYIVVDGLSSDSTLEILAEYQQQYPNLQVISEKDNSMTEALNRGIKSASGEIVASINADDWYEPGAIAHAVSQYQKYPFSCLIGNTRHATENNETLFFSAPWLAPFTIAWHLMGCITPESSVFYSAACIKHIGLFNEELKYTQDLEYYLRILKQFKITYSDYWLSNFLVSEDQYSHRLHDVMEAEVLSYINYRWLRQILGGTNIGAYLRILSGIRKYPAPLFRRKLSALPKKFLGLRGDRWAET